MKKRYIIISGIVGLVSFVVLFLIFEWIKQEPKVAVISLVGPIQTTEIGGFFGGSTITPEKVRKQLERAVKDKEVKAIVLRVESPGGMVGACQEIVAEIERVEKPIVVSMGDIAISGGYFISAKADKIVALPGTQTGSIGVITQIPNVKELFEKVGIKMEVFTAGKHKGMGFIKELTPEQREIIQKKINQWYEQFIKTVAEGRKLDEEKVRKLATGEVYSGTEAKELGLIDELGGLREAIDLAAKLAGIEKPKVEYYKPKFPSLLSFIFGGNFTELLGDFFRLKFLGPEDVLIYEILNHHYYPEPRY